MQGRENEGSIMLGKCLTCQCHAVVEVLGEGKMAKVEFAAECGAPI